MVGEAGLLGKTFGGQVIGVALRRYGFDGDEALGCKILDIGVHEPEGDAEARAQVSLGEGTVVGEFIENLKGTELLCTGRGCPLDVHCMNISRRRNQVKELFDGNDACLSKYRIIGS